MSESRRSRRFLGEMLLVQGIITREQLDEALAQHKVEKGSRLGRLLVDMGHVTEVQISEAIAEQLNIPAADLQAVDIPSEMLAKVSKELALKHLCLPWFVEGQDLFLIMADPTNIASADAVAFHTGLRVKPVVAPESEVVAALERFYAVEESSLSRLGNLNLADQLSIVTGQEAGPDSEETLEQAAQAGPLVKLVNAILVDAIQTGASEIHLEPQERAVVLLYRVDGLLRQVMTMPKRVEAKLVSRIKVMSHLDISERRKPQDGRTHLHVGGTNYDLRVSTLPAAGGEKCVLRILAQDRARVALDELGFEPDVLAALKEVLARPQGMILVTGPAGSGKTSTLYAALNHLRSETTDIVTVEDPIECRLAGVNQVAVAERSGLTFAAGLRSILRQDPDIVMVGEIRDLETAQIAFQASQTGHLVLSTLHTNDAPSALMRLVEMGVPAYVVASSLLAVLAQRLARRLCDCKEPRAGGSAAPKGCEACHFSGFRGRLGVYELMRVTPRVRSVLLARASHDVIRRAAQSAGMATMYQDGLRKSAGGLTTPDEVRRVAPPDEPVEETAPAAPAPPPPTLSTAAAGCPARILVVDDDPALVEVIRDILLAEHYQVLTAGDGAQALSLVYATPPDLIITDLRMPGMDGLELLRKLRGELATCQIPVIFLTAVDNLEAEVKALDQGADDYLGKPVERGRLLGRVRRALLRGHLLRVAP